MDVKCQAIKSESANSAELYRTSKQAYLESKDAHAEKLKAWRISQTKVKRLESDIGLLKKEIERLEA